MGSETQRHEHAIHSITVPYICTTSYSKETPLVSAPDKKAVVHTAFSMLSSFDPFFSGFIFGRMLQRIITLINGNGFWFHCLRYFSS